MTKTVRILRYRRITEEKLKYAFSQKEIQEFFKNSVSIFCFSTEGEYRHILGALLDWCNKNCEGLFIANREKDGDSSSGFYFYFQLESDLVQFKLVYDDTEIPLTTEIKNR